MKWNLKSIITLMIVAVMSFAFTYVVVTRLTDNMANAIAMAFVTMATSTVGFYIGYQTNKPTQVKVDTEEKTE